MVGIAIVVGCRRHGREVSGIPLSGWIDQTLMADLVVTPHEEGLEADPRENVFLISPETVQRVRAVPGSGSR